MVLQVFGGMVYIGKLASRCVNGVRLCLGKRCRLVLQPGANKSELCRRFEISRPTGDKWIERFQMQGKAGLAQRSRRPQRTPARTTADIEETIVAQRKEHPAWGTRTLKAQGAPASARTQGSARSGEHHSRDPSAPRADRPARVGQAQGVQALRA